MCEHEAASTSDSTASGGEEGAESEDDSQADDPEESISDEDLPTANIQERPKRQTRGKRWTVLDGKDLVDDEEFWHHADFQDASSDSEFQGQEDSSESQDSDFSQKTPEEAEPQEQEPLERAKRRKVTIPGLPREGRRPATGSRPAGSSPTGPKVPMVRANRILRHSTMEQRQLRDETKARAAAAELGLDPAPKKEPKPSMLTQEMRLEEAVRTEERSREEFKALQSQEDERRRSRRQRRRVMYNGPRIRFVSRLCADAGAEPLIGGRPGVENSVEFIDCSFEEICGGTSNSGRLSASGAVPDQISVEAGRMEKTLAVQRQCHLRGKTMEDFTAACDIVSFKDDPFAGADSGEEVVQNVFERLDAEARRQNTSSDALLAKKKTECDKQPPAAPGVQMLCSIVLRGEAAKSREEDAKKAYCLWLLCAILLVVIPLFATFATENVWVKESFYRAQPAVSFTNELFLIASGDTVNSAVGWSNQPSLQSLLPPEVKVPLVRSSFSDPNHDGVADTLKLSVELPSSSMRHLTLLAVYEVKVRGKVSEELSGLMALDLSSPYLASGLSVYGQMVFRPWKEEHLTKGQFTQNG
ncbi:unnamed protein product [Cladocopium goreaui]|uniref:Transmembrane protein 231 n=1 Tax=Cladocopium goreaui TaxID=2562237 RepID=A0A9P1C4I3_9DINO|nr:unnamed protein product [Cladocopium goreaui]